MLYLTLSWREIMLPVEDLDVEEGIEIIIGIPTDNRLSPESKASSVLRGGFSFKIGPFLIRFLKAVTFGPIVHLRSRQMKD